MACLQVTIIQLLEEVLRNDHGGGSMLLQPDFTSWSQQTKTTTPYIFSDADLCFGSSRTEGFLYTKVKQMLDILRLPCFVGRPH